MFYRCCIFSVDLSWEPESCYITDSFREYMFYRCCIFSVDLSWEPESHYITDSFREYMFYRCCIFSVDLPWEPESPDGVPACCAGLGPPVRSCFALQERAWAAQVLSMDLRPHIRLAPEPACLSWAKQCWTSVLRSSSGCWFYLADWSFRQWGAAFLQLLSATSDFPLLFLCSWWMG